MKILEGRPERYDKGTNIISAGHTEKARKDIIQTYIKPGFEMLDIGRGAGKLIANTTKAGATVTGIDISDGMLSIAKNVLKRKD